MARIGIIGGGAFGTAMACVVRRAGHDTTLWAREPEVAAAINGDGINQMFLPGVRIAREILATNVLAEAVAHMDVILMAVPAQHLRSVALLMQPILQPGTPVVTCSKGIERGSCALMPEVVGETLPQASVAVLSGPSFAREIANDLPCGVVLACRNSETAYQIAAALRNPRFCVHPAEDVTGVAIGGVMKNVIAIASGIAAGRKLGENARATVITLGLEESLKLGLAKGASAATFVGLAGAGDMMLTANSLQSRNTSLGVALGEGRKAADVLAARKEVTEGAHSAASIAELARRHDVPMPIARAVDQVLNHGADIDQTIAHLLEPLP